MVRFTGPRGRAGFGATGAIAAGAATVFAIGFAEDGAGGGGAWGPEAPAPSPAGGATP